MGMIALKDGEILYVNNQSDILEIIEEKCGNEFKRVVEHELLDADKIFGFYTDIEKIIEDYTTPEIEKLLEDYLIIGEIAKDIENLEKPENPMRDTLINLLDRLDKVRENIADFLFDYDYDSFKDKI